MNSVSIPYGRGPISMLPAEAAAILVLMTAATALMLAVAALRTSPSPAPRCELACRVDPMSATRGELVLLPGIGPARAERIAALRGNCSKPDEALLRAGLSPAEIAGLHGFLAEPRRGPR